MTTDADTPPFDFDDLFDDDYLHFYAPALSEESTDHEATLIADLADLQHGDRVLDVCCGHGRIANRLAAEGALVVGVDRTPLFLERARADAEARGVDVQYLAGDMRELPFREEFDVVLSWFTSFGYYDDATNRRVLEGMFRALKPGGRLLLETINRDLGKLSTEEQPWIKEVDGEFMIDQSRFDPIDGRIVVRRFVARSGRPIRSMQFFMRVFTFTELRTWLEDAGFENVMGYGGEGEVYRLDSARMIVVAHRG